MLKCIHWFTKNVYTFVNLVIHFGSADWRHMHFLNIVTFKWREI